MFVSLTAEVFLCTDDVYVVQPVVTCCLLSATVDCEDNAVGLAKNKVESADRWEGSKKYCLLHIVHLVETLSNSTLEH